MPAELSGIPILNNYKGDTMNIPQQYAPDDLEQAALAAA